MASSSKMNTFTQIIRPELLGNTPLGDKMTFAVKANIGCGYPASASTPSLRGKVPKGYSPVVRSLVDDGHQIVAMANMHELAFGITSENPAFGDVENPRKPGYIAGGSSGGSAAAVAMNAVSFALGTDTGGSMRIPASLCGVVGYRPTIGLYDPYSVLPLSSTTDTIGIFAQRVDTVQQVHKSVVKGIAPYSPAKRPLKGVRIGVPRQFYYSMLDTEVDRVTKEAHQSLTKAGVELVDVNFSAEYLNKDLSFKFIELIAYETNLLIPEFLKDQHPSVSFEELGKGIGDPEVKDIILKFCPSISEATYRERQQMLEKVREEIANYFTSNNIEAFVIPTTILPAVKRPSPKEVKVCDTELPILHAYIHNMSPQVMAGCPCISLPSGVTRDGLPVGLELVAPRGKDGDLLDLAASVQEVLPPMPQLSFDNFKDKL